MGNTLLNKEHSGEKIRPIIELWSPILKKLIEGKLAKSSGLGSPAQSIFVHSEEVRQNAEKLEQLGCLPGAVWGTLLQLSAIFHDIGKINEKMQLRLEGSDVYKKFSPLEEIPHHILSFCAFSAWLKYEEKQREELSECLTKYGDAIAYAILHHHPSNIERYEKDEVQKALLKDTVKRLNSLYGQCIQEIYPQSTSKKVFLSPKPSYVSQVEGVGKKRIIKEVLTGLLMKCDYAASGGYEIEYAADFLEETLASLLARWQQKNGAATWNGLQHFCATHRRDNLLIIGETGIGKTEGALLWIGNKKGYFFLPVRTAINAMYNRIVADILQGENLAQRIGLLHGNDLEQYLKQAVAKGELSTFDDEVDAFEYRSRGRNFTLPLSISTVDQLFDFVLYPQRYEFKLANLAISKLVIDEIQMYDAPLLAALVYGLGRVLRAGGQIAIITATLPPFIKTLLIEELNKARSICPEITPFAEGTFLKDTAPRHHVKVQEAALEARDILALFEKNRQEGKSNKILVVCNTIGKTQELYRDLKACQPDLPAHLFHSRFIKLHRRMKEQEILAFGRTYEADGSIHEGEGIWLTTSICEASLDIDFDYLFTELQYLPSLFQRFGRCNRKGVKNTDTYNCFVYTEIPTTFLRTKNNNQGFIDETLYALSKEALLGVDGLMSEQAKLDLLDTYFTMERVEVSPYMQAYKAAYENYASHGRENKTSLDEMERQKLRDIDSETVIPQAILNFSYEDVVSGQIHTLSEPCEDDAGIDPSSESSESGGLAFKAEKGSSEQAVNEYLYAQQAIIKNAALPYQERIQAKQNMEEFTVSIGRPWLRGKLGIFEVSSYQHYKLVPYEYSYELGLVLPKKGDKEIISIFM